MSFGGEAVANGISERVADARQRILAELRKVIVGQDEVVDQVLVALFTGGHCLITGVPGLAKTLLIKTLAEILDLSFKRIQFTPDLMPADITGTEILDEAAGMRSLRFVKGPVFAQIILADEINRTPPKTQAALLEAMQEYQVTVSGIRYDLERPLFVLATQNPIEQEGTYPLPEAQLDRFLLEVDVTYPALEAERIMLLATTGTAEAPPEPAMTAEELRASANSHGWSLDGVNIREYVITDASIERDREVTMYHTPELELGDTISRMLSDIREFHPDRVVIDALSELRLLSESVLRYRRQLLALKRFFNECQCTVLLLDDRTNVERDAEIRQMLEARNARRAAQGRETVDVEAELAELTRPAAASDPEILEEVRALVRARNSRRIARGQEPLDEDAEVARQLRDLPG